MAMAVVVQRLVRAEVAGVLFTRDPLDPTGRQMLVEASWGLGESVVSGRVTPDRYHLDRATGKCLDRHIAAKTVQVTLDGEQPVPAERQGTPCLNDDRLAELADWGRRVEALFGEPRDIEWALEEGRIWLLQARPITTGGAVERAAVRQAEIATLRARAAPGGTVWSRFNLSEVLPAPTPMTWTIIRRLMSGRGGFGLMYRDLGYDPDPVLDEEGIFDLVCGRPYCNLSREARLHYRHIPFEHPFARLRKEPARALYPAPGINPTCLPWHAWLLLPFRLPGLAWRLMKAGVVRQRLSKEFPAFFRAEIVPAFRRETEEGAREDLTRLDDPALLARLEHWVRRTLVDFARDSLKPTALAALGLGALEQKLAPVMGLDKARALARDLVMGVHPDPEADLPAAVRDLAGGRLAREEFLRRFGHRGPEEMELSRPRWAEAPSTLGQFQHGPAGPTADAGRAETWARVALEARLNGEQQALLKADLDSLHAHVGLRETAKHYLMYGYALVRRVLLEIDRRARLGGGVFFLTPEELPRLLGGDDLSGLIAARRRRRALALALEVPPVLFSDDLEVIGQAVESVGFETLQGVPVSAGVAEAPALVLDRPPADPPQEGYILVCPSTDPAWVPLFVRARGLVMETGGVLSHGAIVAREFGLPAVVGLAVLARLRSGQRLRVDGTRGTVTVLE
jgi:pyruvate,water dikinase